MKRLRCDAGTSILEFAILGPTLLLITISLFQICLAMWSYETLAFGVREGARYCATKGQGCSYSGNTCSVTVATVAQQIASYSIGLDPNVMNVTLAASGSTSVTCNPLNSCYANTATWPPSTGNSELNSTLTVSGTYPFTLFFVHPVDNFGTSSGNLQASSQQLVEF